MSRLLGVLSLLVVLALPAAVRGQAAADRYDATFRKYSKRFFGVGYDWRVFKAQGLVESRLDTAATSRVGARGIMQLMPSTFREIQTRNPDWVDVNDPEWNIAAGVYHDRRLWRLWRDSVNPDDERRFMFGSYNAGRGPILRAQSAARLRSLDPRFWATMEVVAPTVTGWRHGETLEYIRRIEGVHVRMDARGRVRRP